MQILESARDETSSPKKERLLELGKIMVNAITQARDAERAMEEAKHAARKAEVAYVLCKKALGDVSRCVEEWREQQQLMQADAEAEAEAEEVAQEKAEL